MEGQETQSVLEGWRIADKASMLSSWQLGGEHLQSLAGCRSQNANPSGKLLEQIFVHVQFGMVMRVRVLLSSAAFAMPLSATRNLWRKTIVCTASSYRGVTTMVLRVLSKSCELPLWQLDAH